MNSPELDNIYEFGEFILDPARRLLLRDGKDAVAISPKAFDALIYLVEHAGQMVERAELSAALWPKVIVEDNNVSQTILALRRGLGDTESGRFILTVPRRGYQFVAQVAKRQRHRVESSTRATSAKPIRYRDGRWKVAAAGLVFLALSAVIALQFGSKEVETGNRSRSIAVLPFANLSPNPQDAYFAAGMHEEVITRLAELRGITVVGRTAVLQYAKNEGGSIAAIAQSLDVDTIMEGSIRYDANRMRINVRLVGNDGKELWSEIYEAPMSDIFDIQSDIATRIAAALESRLTRAERKRLSTRPTESMEAYAIYLRALVLYRSAGAIGVSMPPQTRRTIMQLFDAALSLDPNFAAARGWRAQLNADSMQFDSFDSDRRNERIATLMASIERDAGAALEKEPSLGIAYAALIRRHMFEYRLAEGLATLRKAQRAAPEDTYLWQVAAVLHVMRNDSDAAILAARRAIELDAGNPGPHSLLSIALRASGREAEAVAAYERMIELAPNAVIGYAGLARTLTSSGEKTRLLEALKLGEQFLGNVRNTRVDIAISYASIGANVEAERLVGEFRRAMQGQYIDPALDAMSFLALKDYSRARDAVRFALSSKRYGMDQLPLVLIRHNSWSDPMLDTEEWKMLRDQLAYRGE